MTLKEIEKIINKCSGEQRAELVMFYKKSVENKLENATHINGQLIRLVCDVSRYLPSTEKQGILNKLMNIKTLQIRTYILNEFKDDFTTEKQHFASFSKWMIVLIDDISRAFYQENPDNNKRRVALDQKLAEDFHKKVLEEFKLVFCSNEKFNSAGNQLLIDLTRYFDIFEGFEDEKSYLMERVRKNFNTGKALTKEKIKETVLEIGKRDSK